VIGPKEQSLAFGIHNTKLCSRACVGGCGRWRGLWCHRRLLELLVQARPADTNLWCWLGKPDRAWIITVEKHKHKHNRGKGACGNKRSNSPATVLEPQNKLLARRRHLLGATGTPSRATVQPIRSNRLSSWYVALVQPLG
jgi:hypothetical protein